MVTTRRFIPVLGAWLVALAPAAAQATFTYQGHLRQGGVPLAGYVDLQFRLYTAASGGSQIGSTLTIAGTLVVEGLLSADLDFGNGAFDGSPRWLEVSVRSPSGSGSYTTLSPRQAILAAPYALYAFGGPGGAGGFWASTSTHVFNTNSGNVGIGTNSPQTLLEVRRPTGGEGVVRVWGSNASGGELQLKSLFNGSGAGNWGRVRFVDNNNDSLAWLTYGKPTIGNAGLQLGVPAGYMQIDGPSGRIGIGTTTPQAPLHVFSGAAGSVTAHANSVAVLERSGNAYLSILTPNANERGILFGDPSSFVSGGIIYNSGSVSNGLQFRTAVNATRMVITESGNVGIGTSSPTARLYVLNASGSQSALHAATTGTGAAAALAITSASNSASAVNASTLGTGRAGTFQITNNSNNAAALYCSTTGTGLAFDALGKARIATSTTGTVLFVSTPHRCFGNPNDFYGCDGLAIDANGAIRSNHWIIGGVKAFCIDHPLDPENRFLMHASIESDELKNLYDGVAVLGADGEATVVLPDWFEALNGEFRYQLTCIGGYAQVYIAEEISGGRFRIAGGHPGMKVSWQVTGVRHDPFAQEYTLPVAPFKADHERGRFVHPELYGLPPEMGIHAQREAEFDGLIPSRPDAAASHP